MENEIKAIKSLIKKTKMLLEQPEAVNLAKSIETKIEDSESSKETDKDGDSIKKDKTKTKINKI